MNYKTDKKLDNSINDSELYSFLFGKMPPHAQSLEEAILGAAMIDKDAYDVISNYLSPDSFYSTGHQNVYKAFVELKESNSAIDLLTVSERMSRNATIDSIGGAYYLVELTNRVASAANLEYHCRIVKEKELRRNIIKLCSKAVSNANDESIDTFELIESVEKDILSIDSLNKSSSPVRIGKSLVDVIKKIETSVSTEGVPSGIPDIDIITGGWQPSDLIIVAARPSMGKSAFATSILYNAAKQNKAVGLFSLEMSSDQFIQRFMSVASGVDFKRIKDKDSRTIGDIYSINSALDELSTMPIYIDDEAGISLPDLLKKSKKLKKDFDIQLLVIDYLQLIRVPTTYKRIANREQEIALISRSLKELAKDLRIPVIALSQLSRTVEARGGSKKPQLSDLRESGAIEQDADIVSFLYRPEYYKIFEDSEGNSTKGLCQLLIQKHRNGSLGDVDMKFIGSTSSFSSWNLIDTSKAIPSIENIITHRPIIDEDTPF